MARHRRRGAYRGRGFYTHDPNRLREQKGGFFPHVDPDPELTRLTTLAEGPQEEFHTFSNDFMSPGMPAWCEAANEPWSAAVCARELNDRRMGGGLCRELCDASRDDIANKRMH